MDAGLLTCKAFPPVIADTDLEAVGVLNRAFDAWADCRAKLDAIAKLQDAE